MTNAGFRTLTSEEIDYVAGQGEWVAYDIDRDGVADVMELWEGDTFVTSVAINDGGTGGSWLGDGSFFGGGWIAGGVGGSVSGGGGEAHGSAGVGFGGGGYIGYSSDSNTAAEEGDNTELQIPGPYIYFDLDPFGVGIGFNSGLYLPVFEKERQH